MLGAVAAEVRERGEIHQFGYLGERQTLVTQIVFSYGYCMAVEVGGDAVARPTLAGGREVFGRHVQTLGIVAHIAFCTTDAGSEQCHKLFHDISRAVAVSVGGIALGMRLEDVIHHRQTETAHQFSVEEQVAIVHAVTQSVEVGKQKAGLFICKSDDRVLVQRDAATDAVVIRWQQVLQELIVSRKPLHLHVGMRRNITDAGGHGYHYQIVLHDVIAPLIEYKTALASRAEQVHTGVAQLWRIHRQEVGGIHKIYLHNRQKWEF